MEFGGVFKFSDILKLSSENLEFAKGCIVDTSILFAVSYPNDAHNTAAFQVFDFLSDLEMPAFFTFYGMPQKTLLPAAAGSDFQPFSFIGSLLCS